MSREQVEELLSMGGSRQVRPEISREGKPDQRKAEKGYQTREK